MHNRRYIFSNPRLRSATALVVLVSICASVLPIPLGSHLRLAKDLSQPFPCQNCACGCKTAEQCWSSCCCFTPAQKAKWAEENGITPPAYAAVDSEDSHTGKLDDRQKMSAKNCCIQRVAALEHIAETPALNCGKCVSANRCVEVDHEDAESTETVFVLSIMAYKCSGQSSVFCLLPWAIIETEPDSSQCLEFYGRRSPDESLDPIRVFLFPDVPPPRTFG